MGWSALTDDPWEETKRDGAPWRGNKRGYLYSCFFCSLFCCLALSLSWVLSLDHIVHIPM